MYTMNFRRHNARYKDQISEMRAKYTVMVNLILP